jgi:hypothetical protein
MPTNPYQPPKGVNEPRPRSWLLWGYLPAAGLGAAGGIAFTRAMGIERFELTDPDTYNPLTGAIVGAVVYSVFLGLERRKAAQSMSAVKRIVVSAIATAFIAGAVMAVGFACWLLAFLVSFTA